jgi:hypothetical protein
MSGSDLVPHMKAVAHALLGEPNRRLSNGHKLRFGANGSLAIDLDKGTFYSFEDGVGGGVLDLIGRERGLDLAAALAWMRDELKLNVPEVSSSSKIVSAYEYSDHDGTVLFEVVRYDPKRFRQRQPDGAGGWKWSVKGVKRVPYRLPELEEAIALRRPIFIVEGEKDADALAQWGIPATCNPGGANKWTPELSEYFRGANIAILPDNDPPGKAHAKDVAAKLAPFADRIRVLELPGLPPKGDVSDWIADGGTPEEFAELVQTRAIPHRQYDEASVVADTEQSSADDALIDELASLPSLVYAKRRKEDAQRLRIGVGELDKAVKQRRAELEAHTEQPLYEYWDVEPWRDRVEGNSLFRALRERIRRHVILTTEQSVAVALWIMFAWLHEQAAVHSPLLLVTSAEPDSGKTTLLGIIGRLVPRSLLSVSIRGPALFRSIEKWNPTILIDEADTALANDDELRAVLNSGWTRDQKAVRCDPETNEPRPYSTFSPKVIGMKGRRLPDTTLSRSIVIELKRKLQSEGVQDFFHTDDDELAQLRRQCKRWADDNASALADATPEMLPNFHNRKAANWRLILAIAEHCGIKQEAWQAASTIENVKAATTDPSLGVQLLAHIREAFEQVPNNGELTTKRLIEFLVEDEERPWKEFKPGRPITPKQLGSILKHYWITSETVHPPGEPHAKGYKLHRFLDAFQRYLGA